MVSRVGSKYPNIRLVLTLSYTRLKEFQKLFQNNLFWKRAHGLTGWHGWSQSNCWTEYPCISYSKDYTKCPTGQFPDMLHHRITLYALDKQSMFRQSPHFFAHQAILNYWQLTSHVSHDITLTPHCPPNAYFIHHPIEGLAWICAASKTILKSNSFTTANERKQYIGKCWSP